VESTLAEAAEDCADCASMRVYVGNGKVHIVDVSVYMRHKKVRPPSVLCLIAPAIDDG